MSVNRIGHMLDAGPEEQDRLDPDAARFADVMMTGGNAIVSNYMAEHPGEQFCLLVLDPQCDLARAYLELAAPFWLANVKKLMRAHPMQPGDDPPLFLGTVNREAGIQAACFMAADEDGIRAGISEHQNDCVAIVCLGSGIKVMPLVVKPGTDAGAAERARRQQRARRRST